MSDSSPKKSVRVECIIPVLGVRDLQTSLRHYVEVLGFQKDWGGDGPEEHIAQVSRDGQRIMLRKSAEVHPTVVWIGVEDAQVVYEEYTAKGAVIVSPPTNRPWALEMHVQDPDDHDLWIGGEPTED